MEFDGQTELAYQLPEFEKELTSQIPVSPSELEIWLSELPLLNIQRLAYQLPKYVQEINRIKLSDKNRLEMLEQLRPIVAHVSGALTKQFRGGNLSLSIESQEIQWLLNILISEMAIGYKRLLFNVADKNPNWFNRNKYTLLAERSAHYLGARICLSYLLSTTVPTHVWFELNSTYSYARKLKLNTRTVRDEFAYEGMNKGNIDTIYNRVLLLTLVSPYSLRSAELEQVYYGLLPWLDGIKLLAVSGTMKNVHILNLKQDRGPEYQSVALHGDDKYSIDCTELVKKLDTWIYTGNAPDSSLNKGMSRKLLVEVRTKLNSIEQRTDERFYNQGEQVDVVIGLQDIDLFLNHINSLVNDKQSPILPVEVDEPEITDDEEEIFWGDTNLEANRNALRIHTEQNYLAKKHVHPVVHDEKSQEVRQHVFDVENESERGACLSCSYLHGSGLYIGELMFIGGFDPQTWTLGIIRWMTVKGKKLEIGLYLLSSQVDQVIVKRVDSEGDIAINALWLAAGEHGDTILLPSAEFSTGDELHLDHKGDETDVVLGRVVWNSEGFSQFCMTVKEAEEDDLADDEDFLIPTWAK